MAWKFADFPTLLDFLMNIFFRCGFPYPPWFFAKILLRYCYIDKAWNKDADFPTLLDFFFWWKFLTRNNILAFGSFLEKLIIAKRSFFSQIYASIARNIVLLKIVIIELLIFIMTTFLLQEQEKVCTRLWQYCSKDYNEHYVEVELGYNCILLHWVRPKRSSSIGRPDHRNHFFYIKENSPSKVRFPISKNAATVFNSRWEWLS